MKHHTQHKGTPTSWEFQAYLPTDCIICYHNNCLDGILAGGYAYQSHKTVPKHDGLAYLLPITYGGGMPFDPAKHPGAHVVFVDFCPTTQELRELLKHQLGSIVVLDHHKTGVENARQLSLEFPKIDTHTNIEFHFDMERSGAGMVAKSMGNPWFRGSEQQLLLTAERFDLWKHEGKLDTDENYLANAFSAMRRVAASGYKVASDKTDYRERLSALTEASLKLFTDLQGTSFKNLIANGKKEVDRLTEEVAALFAGSSGTPYCSISKKSPMRSFLLVEAKGDLLPMLVAQSRERFPDLNLIITYQTRGTGLKLSLRQGPSPVFDMTAVAKQLDPNGGGHADSAGATVQMTVSELTNRLLAFIDANDEQPGECFLNLV